MSLQPLVVTRNDYPRPLRVVGEQITILASGAGTGSYEIFMQEGAEGSGPPPHSHPWDEAFYVTRGEVAFGLGPDQLTAQAGTLVHIPAGTVHWFRFGPGGGAMFSVTTKLGASRMFEEIDREICPTAPDMGKLVQIATQHGLTLAL